MFPAIPAAAEPLVQAIGVAFTEPTLRRFLVLMCGLIVTMGRRTVSHALLATGPALQGHWSNYHRVYSSARFSMWKLAAALVRQVIALLPAGLPIVLVGDDTVDGKEGKRVWALGSHRDARRSSRSKGQVKFGHRWLVLCVLVRLPGVARPWALPILCGLCLSPKVARRIGRRPKTPSVLTRQMLIVLMRWLPDKKFILLGDYQVVTHETTCFAQRHADRVTVVSRLRGDANLYDNPVQGCRRRGRRGKKGRKLPAPAQRIQTLRPRTEEVAWYGSSRRVVRHVSETALWFNRHSSRVVPIRWVCVLAQPGIDNDNAYFYSNDTAMDAARVIELYALRWNIEVTFEEARAWLGIETTRHWCRQSVLRVTPILFGLFTAVTLLWQRLPQGKKTKLLSQTPCYRKRVTTFADALFAVRRELWQQCLLRGPAGDRCLIRIPPDSRAPFGACSVARPLMAWHAPLVQARRHAHEGDAPPGVGSGSASTTRPRREQRQATRPLSCRAAGGAR
jgi:hypothetical protein